MRIHGELECENVTEYSQFRHNIIDSPLDHIDISSHYSVAIWILWKLTYVAAHKIEYYVHFSLVIGLLYLQRISIADELPLGYVAILCMLFLIHSTLKGHKAT